MGNFIRIHLWSLETPVLPKIAQSDETTIEITFPAKFESTKPIRDFIHSLLSSLCVSRGEISRLVLITDELVNNSIEHGSAPREHNILTLHLRFQQQNLHFGLTVRDHGNGAYPKHAADMEKMRQEKCTEGFENYRGRRWRGLFQITTKVVDALRFSDHPDGGLVVSVEKTIRMEV